MSLASRYPAFGSPNFTRLWIGLIVSNVGAQMQIAGMGWLIRDMTPDPLALGLVSLAGAVPMVLLPPFGGAIADRFPLRRLLIVTQLGMATQSVIMAALTVLGLVQLWQLVLLTAMTTVFLAVDNPARQALLPDIVTSDQLQSAISLYSVIWSGAALFGPALAGLLLEPVGPGGLFTINTLSYTAVLYAIVSMRGVRDHLPAKVEPVLSGVMSGIRYAASDRLVRNVLLLMLVGCLFGRSHITLMPIFARDVLGLGAAGYGLLLAAPGAGALLGGLGLASRGTIRRRDAVLLGGLAGMAVALLAFSVSRIVALDLVFLLLAGGCTTVSMATASTLLQMRAPRAFRGRVMSLATVCLTGLSQMSGLLGAAVATVIGAPAAVAAGAVLVLGLTFLIGLGRGWRSDARAL